MNKSRRTNAGTDGVGVVVVVVVVMKVMMSTGLWSG